MFSPVRTCGCALFRRASMSPSNRPEHTYPPSSSSGPPTVNPQLMAEIENMLQTRLNEVQQTYQQELRAREEAWERRELEAKAHEATLQAKVQDLTRQMAASTQLGCVLVFSVYFWQ